MTIKAGRAGEAGRASGARAAIRIGAVAYLNARPLTWALDRHQERWRVRYDVPSVCAALLHQGDVDLGLVPSIEYLARPEYRFVPGVGIGSQGSVASVAVFTPKDIRDARVVALDTSSKTSVALLKILCTHRFGMAPAFVEAGPDLAEMLQRADGALLIGDPALEADHEALGVNKIDLGAEWTAMTGLPFIYAAWTGRPGAVSAGDIQTLQDAQAEGQAARDAIAAEYAPHDAARAARAALYLRDNVRYGLGREETAGLQLFLDYAADLGLAPRRRQVEFY